jgi:hypothetical protein
MKLKKQQKGVNMTVEALIDKHWDELFHKICEMHDDLYELKIEYKETASGKTIIRSWKDREDRLKEDKF